ncbi:S-layer homology domain-containing protein [Ellagibacter isourolithinifaciens]|uniref:S-layer homology domain-containing protein n=1 Tax=Ellagibacter isourolithinifaciens TaxID=2137581 RepID=UPI0023F194AC|nr:S-layer homology domain-containing protein [Ellagibacter isourolithinifaciens]MDD5926518.1 S-layer homology domain-containing protein [Ellagibacter isourolithinifaciens]
MTACKDSLNGKKAVSATLAGVLAVGMVPAAAFAAEAPADEVQNDGIELLDTTSPVTLFNAGTIALGSTFSPVSGQTNQFTANATTDGTALDLGAVTVTPKGQSEVTATGDDFKVTITKDGTEVKEIKAPGTYTVSVEAVGGDYKGGKVSATITVKGASLENAELFQVNPDNAKDVSDKTFTYTGNVLDLGVQIGGKALKAGTDYTIKFVKAGGDANNDPAVEVKNADTYYAVITGQGNFVGNVKKIADVKVDPFDLSKATVSVDDVYGATAAKPSTPTSVKNGSDVLANPAEVKLTLNGDKTWDAKGEYTFTAKADVNNANITGEKTDVTCNKVDAVATFEYDGAAFPTEFTSNNGDKKPVYFDLDKIAAKDAAGKAVDESLLDVTVTDKNGNNATADFNAHKAGTYTVKAAINDDTYTLGGSAECKVVIKEATVVTAENVVVKYQGKIVTSVEKNYDGDDIVASDFEVTVTDAKGNVIEGSTQGLVDAEGKAVDKALNAGSYKLVIENDNVVFQGEAVVPITINKVDLSTIKVGAEESKTFDKTANAAITYVPKGTEVADLGLKYQSGTDKDGKPEWTPIPANDTKVTVKDASGKEVTKLEDEGIYTIEIAAADDDAALNYTFPTEVSITVADEANLKFADNVDSSAWYYNEVNKAAELGLMNGYADTNLFGPNDTITRAQVAQVLFNMAGHRADMDLPEGSYNEIYGYASFVDVNGKMWYGKAIAWAKAAGIVTGYGDGTFAPENNITREEFATMLARYAQKYGNYTAGSAADFAAYGDASVVDSWAAEYVAWAVKGGYMGKNTNVLTPLANMTRAEAAAMVVRYAG